MKLWVINAGTAVKYLQGRLRRSNIFEDSRVPPLGAMLSIRDPKGGPGTDKPYKHDPDLPFCELRFFDAHRNERGGPDLESVRRGIEFLREHVHGDPDKVLAIHCTAGRCRSTAMGAVALYLQGVPEDRVFPLLKSICFTHKPEPNASVLKLADEILGTSLLPLYKEQLPRAYWMWSVYHKGEL